MLVHILNKLLRNFILVLLRHPGLLTLECYRTIKKQNNKGSQCDDLIIVVDHKPLTKILGDRTLDEIANNRLFRLKQRTLPWIFEIYWMPGKGNSFGDATSQHPVTSEAMNDNEISGFAATVNLLLESDEDQFEGIAMVKLKSELNKVKAVRYRKTGNTERI